MKKENEKYNSLYHPHKALCNTCKHFIVDPDSDVASCAAFNIIPGEILSGEVDHNHPVRGDNGIRYEPVKEVSNG